MPIILGEMVCKGRPIKWYILSIGLQVPDKHRDIVSKRI